MDGRQTAEEVRRFLKARVPVIVMRTVEPTRALAIVNEMANDFRQMPFFSYSRTEGLREVLSGSAVTEAPACTSRREMPWAVPVRRL